MAHNRMKKQADQSRFERQIVVGDQVFLHLQQYKRNSLKYKQCEKISPKFYGPYTILKRVGPMAYQLDFPNNSKLHPLFHVSCLKKMIGNKFHAQTSLLELYEEGSIWFHPQAALD
jgi:hypothetical protein